MADLAKLVVKLEAETARYQSELDKAKRQLGSFEKSAGAAVARIGKFAAGAAIAAAAGFGAMLKSAIDTADQIGDLSTATGIATESLSQLQFAAEQSGTDLEGLAGGIKKLSRAAVEAAQGSKSQAEAFAAIGVAVTDTHGALLPTEELLLQVAERFSQYQDGAAKAAVAQELFGKSGTDLIPFLNQGRKGIEDLKGEAERLGLTISGNTAQAADDFKDSLNKLKAAGAGLARQAASTLLPVLADIATRIVNAASSGGALELAFKTLAVAFKSIVTAGVIVTSVFQQLGTLVYGVAAAIVRVAQGEFRLAGQELSDAFSKARGNVTDDIESIVKLWSEKVPEITATAKNADDKLKKTLIFGGGEGDNKAAKAAERALESIREMVLELETQAAAFGQGKLATLEYDLAQGKLSETFKEAGTAAEPYRQRLLDLTLQLEGMEAAAKKSEDALEAHKKIMAEGAAIFEATRTPLEKYQSELQKLDQLVKSGAINQDTFIRAQSAALNTYGKAAAEAFEAATVPLKAYEAEIEKLNSLVESGAINQETYSKAVEGAQDAFEKASEGANKFLEEATRNAQDIIANALKNGFEDGAKGILDSFKRLIIDLTAEAVAADIGRWLFGKDGLGSGGGIVGKAAGFFAGLFGGPRAEGGPVNPSQMYMVGERGPELFVPDTAGRIEPSGWNRSTVVNINVPIHAPNGTVSRETRQQVAAAAARAIGQANMRNN